MSERIQVVYVAHGMLEAEMLKSILLGNGIDCNLTSSGMTTAFGFTVGPMSEVLLYVAESQCADALAIIDAVRNPPAGAAQASMPDFKD